MITQADLNRVIIEVNAILEGFRKRLEALEAPKAPKEAPKKAA